MDSHVDVVDRLLIEDEITDKGKVNETIETQGELMNHVTDTETSV